MSDLVLQPIINRPCGGQSRIVGIASELNVPGPYRVRLHERTTGVVVQDVWSAADGTFAFNALAYRASGYYAIAFDHGDNPLNAVIADLITPEPTP